MGSTGILFQSLNSGAIDVYPDYTGTLAEAILKQPQLRSVADIRAALLKMGIVISEPLGFDNTYALAVPEAFAQREGLHTIGDLARLHATLRAGFSYEFMDRQDGYPGLAAALPARPRPRAREPHGAQPYLPGDRRGRGGCDRCLFHGRENQEIQSAGTDGQSRLLPLLPGGVGGTGGVRRAVPGAVARAAPVGRPHQRHHHAGPECAGRYRQAQCRAGRRRVSRLHGARPDAGRTDWPPDPRASVAGGRLAGIFDLRRHPARHPRRAAPTHWGSSS